MKNAKALVAVIMGSDSDFPIMKDACEALHSFGVPYEVTVLSAHRTPERAFAFAKEAQERGIKVIIAAAGGAAHLAGVMAGLSILPIIGVPILTKTLGGADSLYSTAQMPPGVPVATVAINGSLNAGILAVQILATADVSLQQKLKDYKKSLEKKVNAKAKNIEETDTIVQAIPKVLKTIDIPGYGKKSQGKVRDIYFKNDRRILITTDRQSAFDVILGHIPFKGAVLNKLSEFWFKQTKSIVQNHMISVPDDNVMITHNCKPTSVEMIVRGYMTGVTKTSIWYSYEKGERTIYGIKFPEGLKKNQKLPKPVLTPTTHPEAGTGLHDERLTREQIIENKIVDEKIYKQMEKAALELFDFGSKWCKKHGLILVDTKYEFGIKNGKLMLIDEIHTPDSSRFWIADTYEERINNGLEPENFDKEFLRLRYAKELKYTGDGIPPEMPQDLIIDLAKRYIQVYEKITGETFEMFEYPIEERIKKNLKI
jgi:phosphoribosylaminoimidazole-succinocarboxamide synthase